MTAGEAPRFLKTTSLPRTFGLELIESVLTNHHQLFKCYPDLTLLLKEKVCPLVLKAMSEKSDFPTTIRILRVVAIIVKSFHDTLVCYPLKTYPLIANHSHLHQQSMESEIFLSMFLKALDLDHAPLQQKVLILEIIRSFYTDYNLICSLYRSYDKQDHASNIFRDFITALYRILMNSKPHFLLGNVLSPSGGGGNPDDKKKEEKRGRFDSESEERIEVLKVLWYATRLRF